MSIDKNNRFVFESGNMKFKGSFKIYQAKNGSIMLMIGSSFIVLSYEQTQDLSFDYYSLEDFEIDDYLKYYKKD